MLNRFNGKVVPFASNATATNRTVFGDTAQSDDIDANLNADFKKGWEIVGINDNPTKQDFNALAYTLGNLVSYLYQQGIAVWNTNQEYFIGSRAIGSDGLVYKALTGTSGTPNDGNNPTTDTVNWEWDLKNLVDKTTAQTIAGIKTFTSSPIIPTPTTDMQSATKKYVDDSSIAIATSAEIRTGTDNTKAVTPQGINETQLGWGQTWQDVIGSRVVGVSYTNTTGRPIVVSIVASTSSGNANVLVTTGGLTYTSSNSGYSSTTVRLNIDIIIQSGATYLFTTSAGTATLFRWLELR